MSLREWSRLSKIKTLINVLESFSYEMDTGASDAVARFMDRCCVCPPDAVYDLGFEGWRLLFYGNLAVIDTGVGRTVYAVKEGKVEGVKRIVESLFK